MEESFFDVPLYREFAQLDVNGRLFEKSTILRFRHRLEKRKLADAKPNVRWSIAMRPGKRREPDKANSPIDALIDKIEKCEAGIRAKVEHTFSVNQAPVWVCESALPGFEEKHAAAQNTVCAVKPVDGPAPSDGNAEVSAFESRAAALNMAKVTQCHLTVMAAKSLN